MQTIDQFVNLTAQFKPSQQYNIKKARQYTTSVCSKKSDHQAHTCGECLTSLGSTVTLINHIFIYHKYYYARMKQSVGQELVEAPF